MSTFNRIRNEIESAYGLVLLIECSLISFFICVLVYKMIYSSILEQPSDFIYFSGFALIMLSKISLPHIHGQKIISRSEELIDELYDHAWFENDVAQQKALVTMMIRSGKSLKINIQGFFDLDLNNLGKVYQNSLVVYHKFMILKFYR
jgi:hypothetical protein